MIQKNKMPIGYWLRKADLLLTEGINNIQSEFGLSRTEWQILNAIAGSENIKAEKLYQMLEPFLEKEQVAEIVLKFVNADIIYEQPPHSLIKTAGALHRLLYET